MESLDNYIIRKLIYNIMFDFKYNDYTDCDRLYDLNILRSLRNIVKYHVRYNEISIPVSNNILNFLSYGRLIKDEKREERYEVINDIVLTLNSQKYDYYLNFYAKQLAARRNNKSFLRTYEKDIIKEIDKVNEAICLDYYVVIYLCNRTSDTEFLIEVDKFINNSLFYESLIMILKENPILFKDPVFYNRMLFILNKNKEGIKEATTKKSDIKEVEKLNKELVKKIDTSIKRIK